MNGTNDFINQSQYWHDFVNAKCGCYKKSFNMNNILKINSNFQITSFYGGSIQMANILTREIFRYLLN